MTTKQPTTEELIEIIGGLTVKQVCELVTAMEDTFGISAAAPVAVAAAPGAAGDAGAAEQTEFDVTMTSFGDNKINVIKAIRTLLGLALKEAKDMVEGVPVKVKEGVDKATAEDIMKQLQEAGATVEIK